MRFRASGPVLHICGFALALLLLGCASSETYYRSEYPFYFSPTGINNSSNKSVGGALAIGDLIDVHCVNEEGEIVSSSSGPAAQSLSTTKQDRRCLYIAADLSKLIVDPYMGLGSDADNKALKDRRDILISMLINYSNQNCTRFLDRAFANKTGLDATKNLFQDLTTGAAAGTAHANPAISAALSGSNLLIGTTVANFDKTVYLNQAFTSVRSTIASKRSEAAAAILSKQANDTYVKYTMFNALTDIHDYAEICSIQAGLTALQTDAQKTADSDKASLNKKQAPPVGATTNEKKAPESTK